MDAYEKLTACQKAIKKQTDFKPDIALVLGSGLGRFADRVEAAASIDYSQLPGFPVSTVSGHRGRFVFGTVDGVRVVVMQGRVHYYEGYPLSDVIMPVRLTAMLGAKALMLTNASGGVNPDFDSGEFMLIRDHIMTFFPNPLRGENIDKLGERFPDMSNVYDPVLCDSIRRAAVENGISLREGVYAQVSGPSFETPAEVRLLGILGADVVGMSTACEAVAANHAGMRVCGISCVTNKGAGLSKAKLTHDEVKSAGNRVADKFETLIRSSIRSIAAALEVAGK